MNTRTRTVRTRVLTPGEVDVTSYEAGRRHERTWWERERELNYRREGNFAAILHLPGGRRDEDLEEYEPVPEVPWAERLSTMRRLRRELGKEGLTSAFRCVLSENDSNVEVTVTLKKRRKA